MAGVIGREQLEIPETGRGLVPALVGAGHVEHQRKVRAECLQGLGVQAGSRWIIGIVRRGGSRGRFGGGFRLRLCSGLRCRFGCRLGYRVGLGLCRGLRLGFNSRFGGLRFQVG